MADDQFEQYYAEKLWEMIPAVYRHEDGIAEKPGTLRALVQVMATQAAIVRRSQDHLWDDQFIELCNEWAVPYIGGLVGTRLLSALNKRGRRIDVSKTIYYRRRKGTPQILEELISDISGWEGKLVEQFRRLGRAAHGLDPNPEPYAGRYSRTLPGGWADLRSNRISELTNGPFEEYFHTPDMRRHAGLNGRYAIPKLAFYLYRLRAFEAIHITPFSLGDGVSFTFDPSGRDIPLFSKRLRSGDWDQWHTASEWELPAPISCRLLGHAGYKISEEIVQQLVNAGLSSAAAVELRILSGWQLKNERSLINILNTFVHKAEILDPVNLTPLLSFSLIPDCGKQALLPDARTISGDPLESSSITVGFETPANKIISVENITSANLSSWTTHTDKALAIDAENGRFKLSSSSYREKLYVSYHYGFAGPTGAGTYDRPWIKKSLPDIQLSGGGMIDPGQTTGKGVIQVNDSRTYTSIPDQLNITDLVIQSANAQRPYIQLKNNWVLDAGPDAGASLILDGLWIGMPANQIAAIVLKGSYACVTIRNCTLDPGGKNAKDETLFSLTLLIEGKVETLCLESCILGPVKLSGEGNVEDVYISDCILQAGSRIPKVVEIKKGRTHISRTTVFGSMDVHRLESSDSLMTGIVDVTDTQNGCFRFSTAPAKSRLPHPYRSFLFSEDVHHWFTSRRFGDPGFAQLSETAPDDIARGAENGSEAGVFNSLLNPIKLDGLHTKIDEYMPFGLIPIFIYKT